jgi:cytochrome c-type biogenesis protein CcmH/NrfG
LSYGDLRMSPTRLALAVADLERALRLRPHWSESWGAMGNVRARQGKLAEAGAAYAKAAALDPTYLGAGVAYADFLARTDVPAAIAELIRLRRAEPAWTLAAAKARASRWTSDPALLSRLDETK